jgi:hypothetical protein
VAQLAAALEPLGEELDGLAPPAERESAVVPIESLAYDPEPDVVPIESLAPAAEPEPVPIASLGYDIAPAYSSFEQTFSTYFALTRGAPDQVPIQSLLYRGRRALERANQVRQQLDAALRDQLQFGEIRPLLGELLDLVPLALDDER